MRALALNVILPLGPACDKFCLLPFVVLSKTNLDKKVTDYKIQPTK